MSDLYRLVYASKNLLQGSEFEIAEAVSQILQASQRNNARVSVTGALMFNAGAFAQVLEGPQQGVENAFDRIQCDPRHGDVTVLQCGPVEARCFENWSMAFVGQSETGRARWDGIATKSGFDLSRLDGDAVFCMLRELVLDEEGVPYVRNAAEPVPIADRPGNVLDVERIRAELPQPGQAFRASRDGDQPSMTAPAAQRPTPMGHLAGEGRTNPTLTILRAALGQERQLTTALRNELDEVRVAFALLEDQSDALRRERDLWAKRAQILAMAISQEAHVTVENVSDPQAERRPVEPDQTQGHVVRNVA